MSRRLRLHIKTDSYNNNFRCDTEKRDSLSKQYSNGSESCDMFGGYFYLYLQMKKKTRLKMEIHYNLEVVEIIIIALTY